MTEIGAVTRLRHDLLQQLVALLQHELVNLVLANCQSALRHLLPGWSAVQEQMEDLRERVKNNLEKWKNDHETSPDWVPSKGYSPNPKAGYNVLSRSPEGTDPGTASAEYKKYLRDRYFLFEGTVGSDALHIAAIGSFRIIATADSIEMPTASEPGKVVLNIWMYNEMSERSFGKFADEWYSTGKPFASSFMWWNWKETFDVAMDANGNPVVKTPQKPTSNGW